MTKRNNNSQNGNSKKPKLDDDIEALWGDEDIDDSDLDDCFKLATQVFEVRWNFLSSTINFSLYLFRKELLRTLLYILVEYLHILVSSKDLKKYSVQLKFKKVLLFNQVLVKICRFQLRKMQTKV